MRRSLNPLVLALSAIALAASAGCGGGGSSPIGATSPIPFQTPPPPPGVALLSSQPPARVDLAFLLTDGSVLAQSQSDNTWYRYVPDKLGSYLDGTWAQAASLPSGYAPYAYSSAVLADGRLVITGGEYNSGGQYDMQLTNLGAVYDPVANTWTPLTAPSGWQYIGDSPSSVLADGRLFVGQKLTEQAAVLDPKTLTWTNVGTAGKADFNAEEGFTLLPDGSVLTLDVKNAPNSERYNIATQQWTSAGSTIVDLHSPTTTPGCVTYGPDSSDCYYPPGEIGPAMLRPDGTVFATGSTSAMATGAGHTAIYHTTTGTWTAGPDFPNGDNAGDSYAVLLPSGNVLVFGVSGQLYEFDGTQLLPKGSAGGAPLLLPTGQVLIFGRSAMLYSPSGAASLAWAPHIASVPGVLTRGTTYTVSGTQFNGMSQAMAFGDESQNATNYPLVRITMSATNHVFYARTHDHTSMGVATGALPVSTQFDVPPNMETGAGTLQIIANGIASLATPVTVQ